MAPAKRSTKAEKDDVPGVASAAENEKLTHSRKGAGATTRDDATDVGVPMLPGSPDEPVGPEDALGEGPKRGDYRDKIVGEPTQTVRVKDPKPGEPHTKLVRQRPRAEDIGDAEGQKGGVDTATSATS